MKAPVVKVEIAYGYTWQTEPGSITWTDETSRVMQAPKIVTSRGATSARGAVVAGTCSFSLRNQDRRFDPTHTAGPHYGLLRPGTPVRVRATPAGGTIAHVWRGTIPSWPQRYDIGNRHAWVPITAYDAIDKLSRAKIPRSVLEVEIGGDSPTGLWELRETTGTVMADSSDNDRHGVYRDGTPAQSQNRDGIIGLDCRGTEWGTVTDPLAAITSGPCAIEAVVAPTVHPAGTDSGYIYSGGTGSATGDAALRIDYTPTNWSVVGAVIDGSSNNAAQSKPLIFDNKLHHIAFYKNAGDSVILIDGVDQTASSSTLGSGGVVPAGATIATLVESGTGIRRSYYGFLADVVAFNYDVLGPRIVAHAAAAITPLLGQTADERINYVLDQLDWPFGLRNLATGRTLLGSATFQPGDIAWTYLGLVNASEDGRLFIDAQGRVTFQDRYWPFLTSSSLTPQVTFTDVPGGKGYAEFELDLDDELVVNIARFTRRGGVQQVAEDAASKALYGEAELQLTDLMQQDDPEVLSLAQWKVATSAKPLPRVPSIKIPLVRYSPSDQQTVLGLELGERVAINRTPQGVGSQIHIEFLIDGIGFTIGDGEFSVELFVSPVPQDTASVFLWDSSLLDGPDILAY